MSEDERVAWLRERITARLEAAKALGDRGEWLAVRNDDFDYSVLPRLTAWPDDAMADMWREGVAQFIAANDPQQVIADCEMQLGILGLYELWAGKLSPQSAYPELGAAACVASDALRHVASAYRYRPGYAEHWGEAATPTGSR